MIEALALGATAAVLAFLARSGMRHPELLVTSAWAPEDRAHRIAVVRRGAHGCNAVAGDLAVLAVLALG